MKTETEIARENIKLLKDEDEVGATPYHERDSEVHKQTCQRWLEFLGLYRDDVDIYITFQQKITDLKSAIKLYEEAGI